MTSRWNGGWSLDRCKSSFKIVGRIWIFIATEEALCFALHRGRSCHISIWVLRSQFYSLPCEPISIISEQSNFDALYLFWTTPKLFFVRFVYSVNFCSLQGSGNCQDRDEQCSHIDDDIECLCEKYEGAR